MKDEPKVSLYICPVWALLCFFYGKRAFVGDAPVHSHMAGEGTLPPVTMSFQYTAQRRYLSCLRISLNITGCFLFMSDVLPRHSCGSLPGWAVQRECIAFNQLPGLFVLVRALQCSEHKWRGAASSHLLSGQWTPGAPWGLEFKFQLISLCLGNSRWLFFSYPNPMGCFLFIIFCCTLNKEEVIPLQLAPMQRTLIYFLMVST